MAQYKSGDVLKNKNGTDYFAAQYGDEREIWLVAKEGYYFPAHGVHTYEDGTVEWNHSGHGRFLDQVEHREKYSECADFFNQNGSNGNHINTDSVKEAIDKFGINRAAYVLASDVYSRGNDGRIPDKSRRLAEKIYHSYTSDFPDDNKGWFWKMPKIQTGLHPTVTEFLLRNIESDWQKQDCLNQIYKTVKDVQVSESEYAAAYLSARYDADNRDFPYSADDYLDALRAIPKDERYDFSNRSGLNYERLVSAFETYINNENLLENVPPIEGALSREEMNQNGIYKNDMYVVSGEIALEYAKDGYEIYDVWERNSDSHEGSMFYKGIEIEIIEPEENDLYGIFVSDRAERLGIKQAVTAPTKPQIDSNVNPEILPLMWNKHEKIAYLTVNEAAFSGGADLLEHNEICEKFGIRVCESKSAFEAMDTEADKHYRGKAANATEKPTVNFLRTYAENDLNEIYAFQVEDGGYPLKLGANSLYGLYWVEPSSDEIDFKDGREITQTYDEAVKFCEQIGVKSQIDTTVEAFAEQLGSEAVFRLNEFNSESVAQAEAEI